MSISIDLVASDAIYHGQWKSNLCLQQRGQKLNTLLDAAQIMQWNQILKNYANSLMNKQNRLRKWGSSKNVFICRKRSKCLHFKMDEKAVRTTPPEFNFFSQMNQAVRTLSFLRIWPVPFHQNKCAKKGKRILMMNKERHRL